MVNVNWFTLARREHARILFEGPKLGKAIAMKENETPMSGCFRRSSRSVLRTIDSATKRYINSGLDWVPKKV